MYNILVSTPGKLRELVEQEGQTILSKVEVLVLDEADRLVH